MTSLKHSIIYSILFFAALLAILNFRFVSSQLRFYFNNGQAAGIKSDFGPYFLPISSPAENTEEWPPARNATQNNRYVLTIPSVGVNAPIIDTEDTNPDKIYGLLEKGVVHYGSTPEPGEKGVSVILGHSSAYPWYRGDYGAIFALLGKLGSGDIFTIEKNGQTLRYRVSESLVFSPFGENGQLAEFEQTENSSVILVSCWPVGTNYKRLAVKADLI